MDGGLVTQIGRTSAAAVLAKAVSTICSLVWVPLVIGQLGKHGFGVFSVILALPTLLTFFEGGLGSGVRTLVAEGDATDQTRAVNEAVRAGIRLMSWTAAGLGTTGLVVVLVLTHDGGSIDDWRGHRWLVLLTVSIALLSLPLTPFARMLEGLGLTHLVQLATVVPPLLGVASALVLRALDVRVLAPYVVLWALGPLLMYVLIAAYAKDSVAEVTPAASSHVAMKRVFETSWPTILIGLALALSYSTDPVVLASARGSGAVAEYSLVGRLGQALTLILYATAPVLWTHFAKSRRTAGGVAASEPVAKLSAVYGAVTALLAVPFVLGGPAVARLWSGGKVDVSVSVFASFALWALVLAVQIPAAMTQSDPAGLRFQVCTTMVMACVNLPLSIVLAGAIGPAGPLLSSAGCLALFHAIPLSLRLRYLKGKATETDE